MAVDSLSDPPTSVGVTDGPLADASATTPSPRGRLELRCSACGYREICGDAPERCPKCGGETWDTAPWSIFSRDRA
jgi:hypothetical protein